MKENKWPDFLLAMGVRFVCGIILGGMAYFLFGKGVLRAFSHDNAHGHLTWLTLCGLAGGFVAIFTVPRRQTPWYKKDSGSPDPWEDLGSLGHDKAKTSQVSTVVRKSVRIKTTNGSGEVHEYSSL